MKHDLQILKGQVTIPDVWQRLGLPGTPGKSCRSPFRPDNSPSLSIYDEGQRWKDFSTGEGGDVIDFIGRACGVDSQEAMRRFLAIAGASDFAPPHETPHTDTKGLHLPLLRHGTVAELDQVARSRCLRPDAIALARSLRTVAFADVCCSPCWILTDSARKIAEARRLDSKPFPAIGTLGERKAHTIKGSVKAWPAGVAVLRELPHFRAIMLVEGTADYLAALHFLIGAQMWDVLPVAMLGRGVGARIDLEALELLRARRVRIYPHNDPDGGGMTSARTWAEQLHAHGCAVDFYPLAGLKRQDGREVNDLNDAALTAPEQQHELTDILP